MPLVSVLTAAYDFALVTHPNWRIPDGLWRRPPRYAVRIISSKVRTNRKGKYEQAMSNEGKWIEIIAPHVGNFPIPHELGRIPENAHLELTSLAALVWQPRMFDEENLYFEAGVPDATGKVYVR